MVSLEKWSDNREIRSMMVLDVGFVDVNDGDHVELFYVPGEMANTPWIRINNKEYNAKYIIEIVYKEPVVVYHHHLGTKYITSAKGQPMTNKPEPCPACEGSGYGDDDRSTCTQCRGTGIFEEFTVEDTNDR